MLLAIQFPLADVRSFLEESNRISKPVWPLPEPDEEFLRFFGGIRERQRGGIPGWGSENENVVCEAYRALTFRSSLSYVERVSGARLPLRRAFGRFYFDGTAVGKFEVGIASKTHQSSIPSRPHLRDVVQHVLSLPVQVRNTGGAAVPIELAQAGKSLARLYLTASTYNQKLKMGQPAAWYVTPGRPLLFVEYATRESLEMPAEAKPVDLPVEFGLRLHQYTMSYGERHIHMWLFGIGERADPQRARRLRLFLLRLHSEHECLRQVLRHLESGMLSPMRGSMASERLQGYFADATTRIRKLESHAQTQFTPDIPDIARDAADRLSLGTVATLLAAVEKWDPRRNVKRVVGEYTANAAAAGVTNIYYTEGNLTNTQGDTYNISGTSGGVINIKSTFGDITQNIGNMANADQATKDELKRLVERLGALLEKAPAAQAGDAEAVADAAKQAVEAAAKAKPNKTTVQISAEGLKRAAENIKAVLPEVLVIATQIATTVMKVAGVA